LPSFDPSRRSADISKLRLLGFAHRVSLVKGIQMMVKNSLSNDI
jgi:nucleoside-diphosphate-sugar epimerase